MSDIDRCDSGRLLVQSKLILIGNHSARPHATQAKIFPEIQDMHQYNPQKTIISGDGGGGSLGLSFTLKNLGPNVGLYGGCEVQLIGPCFGDKSRAAAPRKFIQFSNFPRH